MGNRDLSARTKLLAQFEVRRSVRSECLLGVSERTKKDCLNPISHLTSRLSLATIPEFACDESIGSSCFPLLKEMSASSGWQAGRRILFHCTTKVTSQFSLERLAPDPRKLKFIPNSWHPGAICNAFSMKIAESEEGLQSRGHEREREVQRC